MPPAETEALQPDSQTDRACMARALELAERGRWAAAPNPCVGAVLTLDKRIVAEGWHTAYGRPHAEVEAIRDARAKGVDLRRCTLWVTLEPCNHHGKTPPCTQAVLEAGIPEVVVGCPDPNPDVSGGGAAFLQSRGVRVRQGVLEAECRALIADFLVWKFSRRPFVFLKLAATLDGRIATRTGHSQWISGPEARREVHALRRRVQAVLVGGETFRQDDPQLTHRLGDGETHPQPLALVASTRLPDPKAGALPYLLRERPHETIFLCPESVAADASAEALRGLGCRVWGLPPLGGGQGGVDLEPALQRLFGELTCHYLLCEGGGGLGLHLLQAGLVDEFRLYLAPKILGDAAARPLFAGRAPETMDQALGLRLHAMGQSGEDLRLTLRPQTGAGQHTGATHKHGEEQACSRG